MTKRFVLVAGNIGSGKTSLTERLGERLGWVTGFESVKDNPYLADFYADMRTWAFHLQVFFLGHRARQHLALARSPESTIVDRAIYEAPERSGSTGCRPSSPGAKKCTSRPTPSRFQAPSNLVRNRHLGILERRLQHSAFRRILRHLPRAYTRGW